jgi:hypothetical protein
VRTRPGHRTSTPGAIATHVAHYGFRARSLERRDPRRLRLRNWAESWPVSSVSEAEWTKLKSALRREYEEMLQAASAEPLASEEAFGGAVGAIAHAAYHLGAIRQKLAVLRAK